MYLFMWLCEVQRRVCNETAFCQRLKYKKGRKGSHNAYGSINCVRS